MPVDNSSIENYIPHRKPMIMVDGMVAITESLAISTFAITENSIFLSDGYLSEAGLIENIAQTAAVQAGYLFRKEQKDIPTGFLAGVKDLTIRSLPPLHTAIRTTVQIINRIFDVTIINGKVEQNGEILCQCELKVLIQAL